MMNKKAHKLHAYMLKRITTNTNKYNVVLRGIHVRNIYDIKVYIDEHGADDEMRLTLPSLSYNGISV